MTFENSDPTQASQSSWRERYLEKFYGRADWVDGTTEFHSICKSQIRTPAIILEIGAGPSNSTSRFLATLGEVHGLDPSPEVESNDALSSASVLDGDRYPFPDARFDACVSNYVVEHVPDPAAHLREVHRVLKPGGLYVLRTPNRFHYVALFAGLTPHWMHEALANRLRNLPEEAHEPYPVVYRMNTRAALVRLAAQAGFSVQSLQMVEKEPSYGMLAPPLFLALMAYERIVNATEKAAFLRANIFAVLRKEQKDLVPGRTNVP
jgi:SAM-dependent methyltransferase